MSKKKGPFIFGSFPLLTNFNNREEELEMFKQKLYAGNNICVLSPRRWGKSTLIAKMAREIVDSGEAKVVMLDMYSCSDSAEFLTLFARETIKSTSTKWQEWVNLAKDVFKSIVPKIHLSNDPNSEFSISFDWEDISKHADEILHLPETIGQKLDCRVIVCLDEFQRLAEFDDYPDLEKKMRAAWQKHQFVSYCLYGSKRHMMTDIFNSPKKPFYRFGDIILLNKIKREKWKSFIINGFERYKKVIPPELAEAIPRVMNDHSWYVQQFSQYAFLRTETVCTEDILETALSELVLGNAPLYQREIEFMSVTQLNLLKAISMGERKLTSAAVMQQYKLGTPNNVRKNKIHFINSDFIEETPNGYEFLDPAFEIWFKHYFFGRPIENWLETD